MGDSNRAQPRISFFLAGERDLTALSHLDPDRDWRELVRGERCWPLQTYLELARRGLPVELIDTLPVSARPDEAHLVVFHAKQRREVARQCRSWLRPRPTLVAIRADNRSPTIADFEIVQNAAFADEKRRFRILLWPQAGMVPRDPGRGARIERLAYKGYSGNLHPELRSARWLELLASRGLVWEADAVPFSGTATDASKLNWNDYEKVDVVVALRPESPTLHTDKPPSKLINAWLAGVPAILGPEVAYRELRRSPLDYLEASNLEEVEAALESLRSQPELYRAMVEHGRERAREHTADALAARWKEVLFELLPALATSPRQRQLQRRPLALVAATRRFLRFLSREPAQ